MKGDGTVTFLLRPSVRIATMIMAGRPLRPGAGPDMSVQEAQFEKKGDFVARKKQKAGGGGGGSSGAGVKSGAGGKGGKAGKGAKSKSKPVVSQKDKVLSWSGFDDTYKASEVRPRGVQGCACCNMTAHVSAHLLQGASLVVQARLYECRPSRRANVPRSRTCLVSGYHRKTG